MKPRQKANRIKVAKTRLVVSRDTGDTSCPAGSFDTAAAPYAQAAIIKNRTWSNAPGFKTWDSDSAAVPQQEPQALSSNGD